MALPIGETGSAPGRSAPAGGCTACGGARITPCCTPEQMQALAREARAFHAARLRSGRREELDERASFTQDDAACLALCEDCGLLLRWPRPSRDALVRTYAGDRYPEERLAEMIAAQVACFRGKVPLLRRLLSGGAAPRVIEVGSFVGGFLEVARTAGFRALGVDPNPQLAESCRERGLAVAEATLEELARGEPAGGADAIVIWNTFDQLADPEGVLRAAARLVRAGGVLALRVPHGLAFRTGHALRARARGPRRRFLDACLAWNNLLSFPYLHGYTVASLDRLVPRFGFRRVAVRGDVLGMLSGRATRGFARAEERVVKQLQLGWIALQARDPASPLPAAPWLDLYYRREAPPGR